MPSRTTPSRAPPSSTWIEPVRLASDFLAGCDNFRALRTASTMKPILLLRFGGCFAGQFHGVNRIAEIRAATEIVEFLVCVELPTVVFVVLIFPNGQRVDVGSSLKAVDFVTPV